MKKSTFTLLLSLSIYWLAAQCPTGDIVFSTQGQIDSFQINYPNCSKMDSSIMISGSGIVRLDSLYSLNKIGGQLLISETGLTDLTGLNQLDSVKSAMTILNNPSLVALNGLENLQYVGKYHYSGSFSYGENGFEIIANPMLGSLTGLGKLKAIAGCLIISNNESLTSPIGLDSLTFIGGCFFDDDSPLEGNRIGLTLSENYKLTDLDGFEKIDTLVALYISSNPVLASLDGLSNLRSVRYRVLLGGNPSLKSLHGLEKLDHIGRSLRISHNDSLATLTGLENLDSLVQCLIVEGNPSLVTLDALSGLPSIGTWFQNFGAPNPVLTLSNNPALSSITGIANSTFRYASLFGTVVIENCPNLSVCHLPNVCNHLESGRPATISGNAPGCNSIPEVEAACIVSIEETSEGEPVMLLSPNPAADFLQIQIQGSEKWDISFFDLQGRHIFRQVVSGGEIIDVKAWPSGIYALRAVSGGRVFSAKVEKQ